MAKHAQHKLVLLEVNSIFGRGDTLPVFPGHALPALCVNQVNITLAEQALHYYHVQLGLLYEGLVRLPHDPHKAYLDTPFQTHAHYVQQQTKAAYLFDVHGKPCPMVKQICKQSKTRPTHVLYVGSPSPLIEAFDKNGSQTCVVRNTKIDRQLDNELLVNYTLVSHNDTYKQIQSRIHQFCSAA